MPKSSSQSASCGRSEGTASVAPGLAQSGQKVAPVRQQREAWHHFYTGGYWTRRRRVHLLDHPLCKFCLERGLVTQATVVDHVERHRGDWNKFVRGPLQSLCAPCHNSTKQKLEQERPGVDADGWPLDRR